MSLRWTSYVAPKPPKGAQKRKTAVFCVKLHLKKVRVVAREKHLLRQESSRPNRIEWSTLLSWHVVTSSFFFLTSWPHKRKIAKIWTIICDNFETVRDRISVSINRKLDMGFRFMTVYDLERRNSPYFALFHRNQKLCRPITSQSLKIDL